MHIKIKTLKGEIFEVDVQADGTLLGLKNEIAILKNQPVEHINIIFNGMVLSPDTKTVSEHGLKEACTVVLLVKAPKAVPLPEPIQQQQPEPVPNSSPAPNVSAEPQNLFQAVPPNPALAGGLQSAFTNILQQNPQMFMQMLMSDPQIQAMSQSNPQEFMQLISDPNFINNVIQAGGQEGEYDPEEEALYQQTMGQGTVQLTAEQKQDVEEIVNMGLGTFELVLQYYVAFGHDKAATVNLLLNEQLDGVQ